MTAFEKLKAAQERANEAMKEARGLMQQAFKEGADELLKDHPIIGGFAWAQYTPYFNDGESCEFGVGNDYPEVWFSDEPYDEDMAYDGEYERYGEQATPEKTAAVKAIKEFLRNFDDELYRSAFGDHVKVSVTEAGLVVNDYDHD